MLLFHVFFTAVVTGTVCGLVSGAQIKFWWHKTRLSILKTLAWKCYKPLEEGRAGRLLISYQIYVWIASIESDYLHIKAQQFFSLHQFQSMFFFIVMSKVTLLRKSNSEQHFWAKIQKTDLFELLGKHHKLKKKQTVSSILLESIFKANKELSSNGIDFF